MDLKTTHNAVLMNSVVNLVEQHKMQGVQIIENNQMLLEIDEKLDNLNCNIANLSAKVSNLSAELSFQRQLLSFAMFGFAFLSFRIMNKIF